MRHKSKSSKRKRQQSAKNAKKNSKQHSDESSADASHLAENKSSNRSLRRKNKSTSSLSSVASNSSSSSSDYLQLSPQQYLLYFQYTCHQIMLKLTEEKDFRTAYEYLMDVSILQRHLNLCSFMKEWRNRAQNHDTHHNNGISGYKSSGEMLQSAHDSDNSQPEPIDSPTASTLQHEEVKSLLNQLHTTVSNHSSRKGRRTGKHSSTIENLVHLSDSNVNTEEFFQILAQMTTYDQILEQYATFLELYEEAERDNATEQSENTSVSHNNGTTVSFSADTDNNSSLSAEELELMRYLYSILRTEHCRKILEQRPEEFPSHCLGRIWQDIYIDEEYIKGLHLYQRIVPQQALKQTTFKNSTLLDDENGSGSPETLQARESSTPGSDQSSYHDKTSFNPLDRLVRSHKFDSFTYSIQQLQSARPWLTPFNRLTGLTKSKKYMESISCNGISRIENARMNLTASPSDGHRVFVVSENGKSNSLWILDRFFGTQTIHSLGTDQTSDSEEVSLRHDTHDEVDSFDRAPLNPTVSVTPDGRKLVVATSSDTSIYILDAHSGKQLGVIDDLDAPITCGCLSTDGTLFMAACGNQVCIYSMETYDFVSVLTPSNSHESDEETADNAPIMIGLSPLPPKDKPSITKSASEPSRILSIHRNDTHIVSGSTDNNICKWNLSNGEMELCINTQYDYSVSSLLISSKNDLIFSVETNRYYVDCWCASTGAHKSFFMDRGTVQQIALDDSDTCLFTVIGEKIWIWNVHTAQKVSRINVGVNCRIRNIHLLSATPGGGSILVLGSQPEGEVREYELDKNFVTEDLDHRHTNSVQDLSLVQHKRTNHMVLLSVARGSKQVYMWHFECGLLEKKIDIREVESMNHSCFTHDSGMLIVLDEASTNLEESSINLTASTYHLKCFDVLHQDGKFLWSIELDSHNSYPRNISVSRDDRFVIILFTTHIVVVPIESPIKYFAGFVERNERIRSVHIAHDSDHNDELITGDVSGHVRKWNLHDRSMVQKFQVGRYRRNLCQCVYILQGKGGQHLLVGNNHKNRKRLDASSTPDSSWIVIHEDPNSEFYSPFPQALFSRDSLRTSRNGGQSNFQEQNPGKSDEPGGEQKSSFIDSLTPFCEIDSSMESLKQTHARIAENFLMSRPIIVVTSDQRYIICADETHGCIRVWDAKEKLFICSFTLEHPCRVLKIRSLAHRTENEGRSVDDASPREESLTSNDRFYVLLCGDAKGNVTCLEASTFESGLKRVEVE